MFTNTENLKLYLGFLEKTPSWVKTLIAEQHITASFDSGNLVLTGNSCYCKALGKLSLPDVRIESSVGIST